MIRQRILAWGLPALLLPICATGAAVYKGKVLDPTGAPVGGARIQISNRIGSTQAAATDIQGVFRLDVAEPEGARLIVTAPGFARKETRLAPDLEIRLELAPVNDAITVTGSAIEAPLTEQAGSVTVLTRQEIEQRNEGLAVNLLRTVPGIAVNQNGLNGGSTALFVRGGDSKFNLVLIDGVPVNEMRIGGYFDFAHIATDRLDRIEVLRGAQSAVYGSYANSSVVNLVTRMDDGPPDVSVTAEGGNFGTRRFAVGTSGSSRGFRGSAYASRYDTNGEVANSDYTNENVSLNAGKRFGTQDLSFYGNFNRSENGVPGPYGSDPEHNYSGLDRVSRNWNRFSNYHLHYTGDWSPRVREELFGSFFLNNNQYRSQFGSSFNKDLRGAAETRTTVVVTPAYLLAFGAVWSREEVKNSFITDAGFRPFALRRDQQGYYAENRWQFRRRLFVNAGARGEVIRTPRIPPDGFSRPEFPEHTATSVNPKLGAAYALTGSTRAHASFGMGIRPPGGFDLAFTDNPRLQPERTRSFDAGIEQKLGRMAALDASYFYNRFYDLIVSLGGSLSKLGSYKSDNLSNARAQGVELTAQFRPNPHVLVNAGYMYLDSEILSLDGTTSLAPQYFHVGQELSRRPKHSGTLSSTFLYRRWSANITGQFRGQTLYEEPNFGAFGGFYPNPGFANVGVNLNYYAGHGLTLYGNLRNALNRHYEEVFGYPSPRLNFVAGVKWKLSRER